MIIENLRHLLEPYNSSQPIWYLNFKPRAKLTRNLIFNLSDPIFITAVVFYLGSDLFSLIKSIFYYVQMFNFVKSRNKTNYRISVLTINPILGSAKDVETKM